tara:strand:+ start:36039 stop:36197 length:159 start_codon:yes stop_codon:yes gene_type:complete
LLLALDNCAGEVEGKLAVVEFDAVVRSVAWYFSDEVFTKWYIHYQFEVCSFI